MNALFIQLGVEGVKPFLTALLLPPVPFLLTIVCGLALMRRHRRTGTAAIVLGVVAVWLSSSLGAARILAPRLLNLSPPLDTAAIVAMRQQSNEAVAIIVLGGGVEPWAPEYQASSLQYRSLERLRYGLWLAKQTGWPVGFSGGTGWAQPSEGGAREAVVAQRIATHEFGTPLRWTEDSSRDTRENAHYTAAMLTPLGITRVVLVTHYAHMPRAVRNFRRELGATIRVQAAPIGFSEGAEWPVLTWLPTGEGAVEVRSVIREWIGTISGA